MSSQQALRTALREVLGPSARSHGYKGTAPTWRKSSDVGDWAVVNVQSSAWSSSESLRCVVNIAFAPEPWLRWNREGLGSAVPKTVSESLGLYRQRLHPEGTPEETDDWWEISDDESAHASCNDMIVQLEHAGWPILDGFFSRDALLTKIRNQDLGWFKGESFDVYFARAQALLLMDAGPSDALETQLAYALDNTMPTQPEAAAHFDGWVRSEAAKSAR